MGAPLQKKISPLASLAKGLTAHIHCVASYTIIAWSFKMAGPELDSVKVRRGPRLKLTDKATVLACGEVRVEKKIFFKASFLGFKILLLVPRHKMCPADSFHKATLSGHSYSLYFGHTLALLELKLEVARELSCLTGCGEGSITGRLTLNQIDFISVTRPPAAK